MGTKYVHPIGLLIKSIFNMVKTQMKLVSWFLLLFNISSINRFKNYNF